MIKYRSNTSDSPFDPSCMTLVPSGGILIGGILDDQSQSDESSMMMNISLVSESHLLIDAHFVILNVNTVGPVGASVDAGARCVLTPRRVNRC